MSTTTTETKPELADDPAGAQEAEATAGHYVTVALAGQPIRLIPPGAWRQSWQRLLKKGETDAFAELVIAPEDLDRYMDIDPTNDEVGEFLSDAGEIAGESLGKSSGPRGSSKRTRKP